MKGGKEKYTAHFEPLQYRFALFCGTMKWKFRMYKAGLFRLSVMKMGFSLHNGKGNKIDACHPH